MNSSKQPGGSKRQSITTTSLKPEESMHSTNDKQNYATHSNAAPDTSSTPPSKPDPLRIRIDIQRTEDDIQRLQNRLAYLRDLSPEQRHTMQQQIKLHTKALNELTALLQD